MYFALFMVVILAITGLIWLLDIFVLRKNRLVGVDEPWYVEYAKSFFPVILLVFVLRSFLVEPFKIPSGSMMPTLLAGDYILVNKFTYGLRVPILNNTMVKMNKPKRGDVIVFHYPPDPTIDYIKRVVGVPGDIIQYQDKRLIINGKNINVKLVKEYDYVEPGANISTAQEFKEQLGDLQHDIIVLDRANQYYSDMPGAKLQAGETITVPADSYFAMGDNRDNSADSRVWGFVPEHNLVGKAFFIWMNFDDFDRVGNSIK
jgi:signal peptidase I